MTDSIVLVVMDDTPDTVPPYMTQFADLCSDGVNFTNHIIAEPLCSPSRASTMTGKFPWNTGVTANDMPNGGYGKAGLLEADMIFKTMHDAGYYTALIGKYQNHYLPGGNADPSKGFTYGALHVPTGVDYAFLVDAGGYAMFDYTATLYVDPGPATLVSTTGGTKAEADYITDVINTHAKAAVVAAVAAGKPLFLYVAPFATHSGGAGTDPQHLKFVPAPRHRATGTGRPGYWGPVNFANGDCGNPVGGGCTAITTAQRPGDLSYNTIISNPTAWHNTTTFSDAELDAFTASHILQIQQAQGIDEMIVDVRAQLATSGIAASTWIMLQSDNGLHLGEHCMTGQKASPYDHDARITFVIRPPGGTTGRDEDAFVSNVDFYNTCLDIAGVAEDTTRDGRSLVDFVTGTPPDPADWRKTAPMAHDGDDFTWEDAQGTGQAPPWRALRDLNYLYMDLDPTKEMSTGAPITGRAEVYVLDDDPWQIDNLYGYLEDDSRTDIDTFLQSMLATSGAPLWDLQKLAIPTLTFGEFIPGATEKHFVMDRVEFHEPGGRYWVQSSTSWPQLAGKDIPLTAIPGVPGLDISGKATSRESYWACTLRISDMNESGVHLGDDQLEENLQNVYLMIATDDVVSVGYSRSGPVRWEFNARVGADVSPRQIGDGFPYIDATILFQIPGGTRRATEFVQWTRTLATDLDNEIIDVIPDTVKKIPDPDVRFRGPLGTISITDVVSDSGFRWRHPEDRDIDSTEYVIVDTKHRRAWLATLDPDEEMVWDTDDDDFTEVSAGLVSYGPGRLLLPIQPKPGGSGPGVGVPDPGNKLAKIDCVVDYSGTRIPTELALRMKQARP